MLFSFLHDRKAQISVQDQLSEAYTLPAGIHQESVLSATLFSVFTVDIPPPPADLNPMKILQYASDVILYVSVKNISQGEARLNSYLKDHHHYFFKWKLFLNPTKYQTIVFQGNSKLTYAINRNVGDISLHINSGRISKVEKVTYLGFTMNTSLSNIPSNDLSLTHPLPHLQLLGLEFCLRTEGPDQHASSGCSPRTPHSLVSTQIGKKYMTLGFFHGRGNSSNAASTLPSVTLLPGR